MRAKRAGKFFQIEVLRAKWAENFWKILHFSPKFQQIKVRLFIFFPEEDKLFISSNFQGQNIHFQKVPAPSPSESNGLSLTIRGNEYQDSVASDEV